MDGMDLTPRHFCEFRAEEATRMDLPATATITKSAERTEAIMTLLVSRFPPAILAIGCLSLEPLMVRTGTYIAMASSWPRPRPILVTLAYWTPPIVGRLVRDRVLHQPATVSISKVCSSGVRSMSQRSSPQPFLPGT